jgi:hypothetical protein
MCSAPVPDSPEIPPLTTEINPSALTPSVPVLSKTN